MSDFDIRRIIFQSGQEEVGSVAGFVGFVRVGVTNGELKLGLRESGREIDCMMNSLIYWRCESQPSLD